MNFLNKNILIGVLIGIVAVLGLQFGMNKYQDMQTQKQLTAFMDGYKNATDKDVFVKNFDFGGKGLAVGLSTSKAAESGGEPMVEGDSGSDWPDAETVRVCQAYQDAIDNLEAGVRSYMEAHDRSEGNDWYTTVGSYNDAIENLHQARAKLFCAWIPKT